MIPAKAKNLLIMGLVVTFASVIFFGSRLDKQTVSTPPPPQQQQAASENQSPRIVSTKPDPLEEAIVSASEIIEITFNIPLENVGEFKSRIDPQVEYRVELSNDRKTAKIIPKNAFELGTTYTLFIGPDSKFDGVGEWRKEQIYHFKTIRYRGI